MPNINKADLAQVHDYTGQSTNISVKGITSLQTIEPIKNSQKKSINPHKPDLRNPIDFNSLTAQQPSLRRSQLQSLFTHNFRLATPAEYKSQGVITLIQPGLWAGHLVDPETKKIMFFGREELNSDRGDKWLDFKEINSNAGRTIKYSLSAESGYDPDFVDQSYYNAEAFYSTFKQQDVLRVVSQISNQNGVRNEKLIERLDQAEAGFCEFHPKASSRRQKYYALYISTMPVQGFKLNRLNQKTANYNQNLMKLETYIYNGSDISMVVGGNCKDEAMQQRGIFKTSLAMINNHNLKIKHKTGHQFRMSTLLHLFGLQATLKSKEAEAVFMSPIQEMAEIMFQDLHSEISSGQIIVGMDNIRAYGKENFIGDHDPSAVQEGIEIPLLMGADLKNPFWQ